MARAVVEALHAVLTGGAAETGLADALLRRKVAAAVRGIAGRVARLACAVLSGKACIAGALAAAGGAVTHTLAVTTASGGALVSTVLALPAVLALASETRLAVAVLGGCTGVGALTHAAIYALPGALALTVVAIASAVSGTVVGAHRVCTVLASPLVIALALTSLAHSVATAVIWACCRSAVGTSKLCLACAGESRVVAGSVAGAHGVRNRRGAGLLVAGSTGKARVADALASLGALAVEGACRGASLNAAVVAGP